MIYFNINISNPAWWDRFENIKVWMGKTPIKHKYWEVQVIKNNNLLRLELQVTTQQDHAGCNLELGLFGYELHFTVYDHRHWDHNTGDWVTNFG